MRKYLLKTSVLAAIAVFGITGCTTKEEVNISNEKIVQLQKELDAKNIKISELETINSKSQTNKENVLNNSLIPANAKPGQCYAKVLVPEIYETKEIKKLVKEAQTNIEIVPATYKVVEKKVTIREASTKLVAIPETYKTITEEILVQPETTKLEVIPATYKTLTEDIMIEPEKTQLITIPATYKTVSEKVLIKPAYTTWKKGRGEVEKVDNRTGEILCLVEIPAVYETLTSKVIEKDSYTKEIKTPAVYKTVSRQAIDTNPTTREIKIPAIYKTVTKQVIDTPATTKEITIPAVCKMVKTKELDTPAKEVKTEIPAVYTMVPTKVKVAESYLKWQEILCETNTTTDVIKNVQTKLRDKNYNIVNIDGVYGLETKNAVRKYQKDNKLNEGALTLETLKSLGL